MANVTWQVAEPAPDPFEAVAGDLREYVVHLCTVADAVGPEVHDLFVDFFRRAFEAAPAVERAEARKILIGIDTIYATMTVVVTDEVRSHDERDVFKLSMDDWDVQGVDEEHEAAAFEGVMGRFEEATLRALEDAALSTLQGELRARGFRLWIYDEDEEEDGETLRELTLAGD